MQIRRLIIVVVAMVCLTYQVSLAQTQTAIQRFSLEEAVAYAIENNQSARSARLEMDIADKKVGEILADGLPQVNANLDLGYNYKIQQVFLPGDAFDPNGNPDETIAQEFGTDYSGSLGFTLDQMVFDGAYFIGLKAARTFTQLSNKDNIKNNIDIAEAVSKAYFGVLVNRERYLLIERNFARTDSLLRDTQGLYEAGFAEKIDVNRAKVQYNNLKVELDNYQGVIDYTVKILKFQMGLPLTADIELTDDIENIEYFDFQLASNFKYENRIEHAQMTIQKDLNDLDIQNINSRYIPTLDLYASYGQNTGTQSLSELMAVGGSSWAGVGVVGLRLNVPIFDGMRKSRQIQQRKLKGQQIDYSFEQLKYNIDLDIHQSLVNYNREIQRMEMNRENMELAREVYDVAKTKYDEGVGSSIEVTHADADYKEAQTNYYNALYEALISKIDLQKAYGVLL